VLERLSLNIAECQLDQDFMKTLFSMTSAMERIELISLNLQGSEILLTSSVLWTIGRNIRKLALNFEEVCLGDRFDSVINSLSKLESLRELHLSLKSSKIEKQQVFFLFSTLARLPIVEIYLNLDNNQIDESFLKNLAVFKDLVTFSPKVFVFSFQSQSLTALSLHYLLDFVLLHQEEFFEFRFVMKRLLTADKLTSLIKDSKYKPLLNTFKYSFSF